MIKMKTTFCRFSKGIFCCLFLFGVLLAVSVREAQSAEVLKRVHLGKGGDSVFYLVHDGIKRKYIVHVPLSYDEAVQVPLVVALHGGGANASEAVNYFQFNGMSEKNSFVVAYPQGTGRDFSGKSFASWNAGRCCGPAFENNVDDVGFLTSMIDEISQNFNINPKKVYMLGFSNGSQMAFRYACEQSEKIAAVVVGGTVGTFEECRFTRPVPIFYFKGTQDPCSSMEGGEHCGGCLPDFFHRLGIPVKPFTYKCNSSADFIDELKVLNGCKDTYEKIYQKDNVECVAYRQCLNNSEVISCIIDGGGHTWPGRKTYSIPLCRNRPRGYACQEWKKAVGPLTPNFLVNQFIWNFFKRH